MPINVNGKLRIKGLTTGGNGGGGGTEFISVWDTKLGDGYPTITLPLVSSGNYNFSVNWGDGNTDTITTYDQAEVTHNYAASGVKTITITGTIEGWQFNYGGDYAKLTSITNIGCLKLGNVGAYFAGCENLTTIGGTFDLIGTTNFSSMFDGCSLLTSINGIGSWDTSAVTIMEYMFYNATAFNQDISGWDVSSVTNMGYMFAYATAFNQDISGWDVSSVIDMGYMFAYATAFNQDISGWNTGAVTNMSSMFAYATAFNQPLNSWNTSAVTDMTNMFGAATAFNQPLNSWDVSAVTNMGSMFGEATSFNQPLNSWNTSAVTDMASMFDTATAFNQDISGWDVSSVGNMSGMFNLATSFNQDISAWDISNVVDLDGFMTGKSTADYSYYDDLLNAWSLLTLQNGVTWGMGTIEYTSAGAAARQDIIDNYSWTISDGGNATPEINYTFKTSRTIGSNVNISITTSTGYWKYNHNDVDSSVNSWNNGQIVVANSNGEFTIIPCLSDGTPSGSILSFGLSSSQITEFNGNGLSNLQILGLQGNSLTSFNGTELSSLHTLSLQGNSLTSFNGTGLSSLTFLDLIGNQLTSLDISPMSNLSALYLADMYGLNSNPMTASSNDSVLNQLEANSINSGTFFTSGGRTSAGTSDYNALIGRGWTILGANLV